MTEIETRPIADKAAWLEWREADMTASVGACLFGADIHPYTTAYREWAIKSGLVKASPMCSMIAR